VQQLLPTLSQLVGGFFESLSHEELIEKIFKAAVHLTQADRGSIFLADAPDRNSPKEVKSVLALGVHGKVLRVPSGQGFVGWVIERQESIICNEVQTDPRFYRGIDILTQYETQTLLCTPIRTPNGICFGALELINSKKGAFSDGDCQVAQVISLFAALALQQMMTVTSLTEKSQHLALERNQRFNKISDEILLTSHNQALQETFSKIPSYAQSESPVLVLGESGTGKELVSRYVHLKSPRLNGPFVVLNCASIPESLFEAELFGVAKGAATGTVARKGKIEIADGGTLFLDEIGEMPLSIQAKLLRVLQDKVVIRVGAEDDGKLIDFRLVAATNRDLLAMIKEGTFREDLYYRIHVLTVYLPELKERKEDIPTLIDSILTYFSNARGWKKKSVAESALQEILNYDWPGNIRELQNRLERAIILSGQRPFLQPEDFDLKAGRDTERTGERQVSADSGKISELENIDADLLNQSYEVRKILELPYKEAKDAFEALLIEHVLQETSGNKSEASRRLGVSREGLRKAMNKKAKAS